MNEPLVSVLMPVYNTEEYVSEAIESILNQTYKNFELIIIDDCSTDGSWSIIQEYEKIDERIKIYRNETNLGISKTRNKGINLFSENSKYYAPMDSDDISLENRIELEVDFLEKNREYGVVSCHLYSINVSGNITGQRNYPLAFKQIKRELLLYSPVSHGSSLIRTKLIKLKLYNQNFTRALDYELWSRLIRITKFKNLDEILYKYRFFPRQGKSNFLKQTIIFTLRVQIKNLFVKELFSFKVLIYIFLEFILLLLPKQIVLFIFKRNRYK